MASQNHSTGFVPQASAPQANSGVSVESLVWEFISTTPNPQGLPILGPVDSHTLLHPVGTPSHVDTGSWEGLPPGGAGQQQGGAGGAEGESTTGVQPGQPVPCSGLEPNPLLQAQAESLTEACSIAGPPAGGTQATSPGPVSQSSAASGHGESPSGSIASPEAKGLTIDGHLPTVVGDVRNILPQDGSVGDTHATLQPCTLVKCSSKTRRPVVQVWGASAGVDQTMRKYMDEYNFIPGKATRMVDFFPPALLSCVDLQLHDEKGRAVYRRTKTTSVNHDLQPVEAVRAVFSLVYFSETLDGKALVIQDDVTKRDEGCAPLERGRMSDQALVESLTHALGGAPQPGVVYLLPSLHHLPISSDVGHLRLRLRVHVPSMGAYAAFPSDITVVKNLTPDLFTARAATGKEVPCTTTNLALARADPNVPFVLPAIPPSAAAAAGPAPADVADMSRPMHVLQNMAAASHTLPPLGGRRRPREEGGQPSDMSCASEAKAARRE